MPHKELQIDPQHYNNNNNKSAFSSKSRFSTQITTSHSVCVRVCEHLGSIASAVPRVSCEGSASASKMQFYSSSYNSRDRSACKILC